MFPTERIKEFGYGLIGGVFRQPPFGRRFVSKADGFRLKLRPIPKLERRTDQKFQILVYHRVLPARDPFAISAMSTKDFDLQMGLLKSQFRVVSLDQLLQELDTNSLKPSTVCVTFDDGYRDNHDHAWPILKRHGIPACIYLATGFIGTGKSPWYDKVLAAMRDTALSTLTYEPAGVRNVDIANPNARALAAYGLLEWLKGFGPVERDGNIQDLVRTLGSEPGQQARAMLDWGEVRAMHQAGICFGAHTVNHPILSTIPEAEMDREIGESKAVIQSELQTEIRHFAYPNGRKQDYTPATMSLLAKHGFASGVTTTNGVNDSHRPRFELLRRQPWETNVNSFHFRLVMERLSA